MRAFGNSSRCGRRRRPARKRKDSAKLACWLQRWHIWNDFSAKFLEHRSLPALPEACVCRIGAVWRRRGATATLRRRNLIALTHCSQGGGAFAGACCSEPLTQARALGLCPALLSGAAARRCCPAPLWLAAFSLPPPGFRPASGRDVRAHGRRSRSACSSTLAWDFSLQVRRALSGFCVRF